MSNNTQNTNSPVVITKHNVTPDMRRALSVWISDVANNINHADPAEEQEGYAKLGRLTAMLRGDIPFVPQGTTKVKIVRDIPGEKSYIAFFVAHVNDMRVVKQVLNKALSLEHFPHAMGIDGHPELRRFRVNFVTKSAAHQVAEAHKSVIQSVSFLDEDREDSGVAEPKVSKRGRKPQNVSEAQQDVTPEITPEVMIDDAHDLVSLEQEILESALESAVNVE